MFRELSQGGLMSTVLLRSFLPFSSLRNTNPGPARSLTSASPGRLRRGSVALTLLGCVPMIFSVGCASSPPISITLTPSSAQSVQQGQTVSVSATAANDTSNKGVTWSLSGSGCSGAACGSLTNQSPTSVTYDAPASIPSDLSVTVTATSAANPSKSASVAITVPATVVTIQNKVTELAAGTGNYLFARFNATVQNDPTNTGVNWTLTANGKPCSPACGTLSTPAPYEVNYAPPAPAFRPPRTT